MNIRTMQDNTNAYRAVAATSLLGEGQLAPPRSEPHAQDESSAPTAIAATEALALCMESGCAGA